MRRWNGWAPLAILVVGLACGITSTARDLDWISIGLYEGVGVAAAISVLVAVWTFRPRPRWPWILFACGILLSAVGDFLWDVTELVQHAPGYTSKLASILYLGSYPFYAAAALGLLGVRALRRDATMLLDALVIAGGGWLTLWVGWVNPHLAQGTLGFWDLLPTVLYPPLDLIVLVVLWRLGRGDLRRSAPWLLLIGAFAVMFVADFLYAVLGMPEGGSVSSILDVGWLMAYAGIGAAALHPGMRYLRADTDPLGPGSDRVRVAVAGLALLAPLLLLLLVPGQVAAVSGVVATSGLVLVAATAIRFQLAAERNRAAESALAHRASHDPLTGLANRTALLDHLGLAARRAARSRRSCAVVFLDLDDFKMVNDSLGHGRGDELLCAVADRLRAATREPECVARLGGDEFVVVLEDLDGTEDALQAAERVAEVFARPFVVASTEITVSASIGVVPNAEHHVDEVEVALRDADLAMYEAKALEHGRLCVFDPAMRLRVVDRLEVKNALSQAIANDELRLEYQPIFTTADFHAIGLEALLRWDRNGQTVGPDEFIPAAESSGLIVPIGEWILERAVADLAARGPESTLQVSVNVSPRQLYEPEFAARAVNIVRDAGLVSERVILEFTESALLQPDPVVDINVKALGAAGFQIAIDDFGTGYSSLAYLKRLDVDWIKIDRMFVEDLGRDGSAETLVRTIIRMADELGIAVIAEGVETPEQFEMLRALGCEAVQGFLLGRPSAAPVLDASGIRVSAVGTA